MRATLCLTLILAVACVWPVSNTSGGGDAAPATQPDDGWEVIAKELGMQGELKEGVYTVTLTRKDLEVRHDDGEIPPEILRTQFQFYRCDCGKMNVTGQFCLVDHETNDVIDALRGGMIKVVSVSPMLSGEHPRVLLLRFQGGGGAKEIAKTLKNALEWVGDARMTTRPVN